MTIDWKRRIAWLGALSLVPSFWACQEQTEAVPDVPEIAELVVITPHAEEIRDAFAERFSLWHERVHGKAVSIRWIYKGTVESQRYIYDQYAQNPESRSPQINVDVFFGGGLAIHRDVAEKGYARPIKLSKEILSAIPAELNGQPLYSPDGSWYGTALGGFGILYNKAACKARGLPVPTTWADLAKPEYRGWVAAADPAFSGSTSECLVLVLLKHGWEEGWGIVTGILANCNGLSPSSGQVGPNVLAGIAVAGLQVEFVARMTAAASPETLDYVSPPSATAVSPDPVTVLVGAPHVEAATHFVEFTLSPEGQALWALPADAGGPSGEPLYRYPIRPDIYEKYADKLVIKGNPFKQQFEFKIDPVAEAAYTQLLPHVLKAAHGGANHLLLEKAWIIALRQPGGPNLTLLKQPPFSREQAMTFAGECAKDPRRAQALEKEWSKLFREKYESVVKTTTAPQVSAVIRQGQ